MVAEAELAEDRVEEAPPLGVGSAFKIEDYMNMRADVHSLDLSERDSGVGGVGRSHVGAAEESGESIRGLRRGGGGRIRG